MGVLISVKEEVSCKALDVHELGFCMIVKPVSQILKANKNLVTL